MELLNVTVVLVVVIPCLIFKMGEAGVPACISDRTENFTECVTQLDTNLGPFVDAVNFTGFLNEMCSPGKSFPLLECVDQYSTGCPGLLGLTIVQNMQFGPYHLADISHFDSAQHICECTSNIGCIEQLISIQQGVSFRQTSATTLSPWKTIPTYTTICDSSYKPWIRCAGSSLWRCKTGVTAKYGPRFTEEDAVQIERLATFSASRCSQVESADFAANYACLEAQARSMNMQACFLDMDQVPDSEKPCAQRSCIEKFLSDNCEDEWVNFFIDAINVYGDVQVPKQQCKYTSGAITLAASYIVTAISIGMFGVLL